MFNSILMWIVNKLLEMLFKRAEKEITKYAEQKKHDAELNVSNDKAVTRYVAAKDRHEKIKASLAIINRTNPS